jgi:hypothetical protein
VEQRERERDTLFKRKSILKMSLGKEEQNNMCSMTINSVSNLESVRF